MWHKPKPKSRLAAFHMLCVRNGSCFPEAHFVEGAARKRCWGFHSPPVSRPSLSPPLPLGRGARLQLRRPPPPYRGARGRRRRGALGGSQPHPGARPTAGRGRSATGLRAQAREGRPRALSILPQGGTTY